MAADLYLATEVLKVIVWEDAFADTFDKTKLFLRLEVVREYLVNVLALEPLLQSLLSVKAACRDEAHSVFSTGSKEHQICRKRFVLLAENEVSNHNVLLVLHLKALFARIENFDFLLVLNFVLFVTPIVFVTFPYHTHYENEKHSIDCRDW